MIERSKFPNPLIPSPTGERYPSTCNTQHAIQQDYENISNRVTTRDQSQADTSIRYLGPVDKNYIAAN
jgi:hypothetical protein